MVYSLKKQAVVHTVDYMADKLQAIPSKPEQVLITTRGGGGSPFPHARDHHQL